MKCAEKIKRKGNNLGISGRIRGAKKLQPYLVKLAVAPRLRPIVTEHRPDIIKFTRLRPLF